MSDQWDGHDETDGLLDGLLSAHAAELRHVIGGALDADSGLANLRPLREPARRTGESSQAPAAGTEPASRPGIAGEGNAVEQLVATLRLEKRQVTGLRERLKGTGRTALGSARYRRVSLDLLSY